MFPRSLDLVNKLQQMLAVKQDQKELCDRLRLLTNPLGDLIRGVAGDFKPLGGGGNIQYLGHGGGVSLGGNTVGTRVTFSVMGSTTVQLEMYMPLAGIPCGAWVIGGPNSSQIELGGNIFGCAPFVGDPCYLYAWAQEGQLPVRVTVNP